jgi:hypothetical protein
MENENGKDNGESKEQRFYETNAAFRAPSQNCRHGTTASNCSHKEDLGAH